MRGVQATFLATSLMVGVIVIGAFADEVPPLGEKTDVQCRWNWECSYLDHIVPLDQPKCYLDVYFFTPDHPIFKIGGRLNKWTSSMAYLIGKRYTEYLQKSVMVKYRCGEEGYCEVWEYDPYAEGTYVKCNFGCLYDPVEYNGKIHQNICLCQEARVKDTDLFCDYDRGNDVYYYRRLWTCETEVAVAMECGEYGRCGEDPKEGIGCWPIRADQSYGSSSSSGFIQYSLIVPQTMNGPIYIAAIQNGRVIAKRPISDFSAEEYIAMYGPVDASRAYQYAQEVGLTSLGGVLSGGAISLDLSPGDLRAMSLLSSQERVGAVAYSFADPDPLSETPFLILSPATFQGLSYSSFSSPQGGHTLGIFRLVLAF